MKGTNRMRITNIRIHPIAGYPRLKGYATIVFDHVLAVNEIKIVQAQRGLCIEFPKDDRSKNKGSESIAPLNAEARETMESLVLKAYRVGGDYFLKEA